MSLSVRAMGFLAENSRRDSKDMTLSFFATMRKVLLDPGQLLRLTVDVHHNTDARSTHHR